MKERRYSLPDFAITIIILVITAVGIGGKLLGLNLSWITVLLPLIIYLGLWLTLVLSFFIITFFIRKK